MRSTRITVGLFFVSAAFLALGVPDAACRADIPPDYDFQWANIGNANNPAYPDLPPFHANAGRGSVSYQYRISKLEITTGQWADFLNMALRQGVNLDVYQLRPDFWGASLSGGQYVASNPMRPVIGLTWRPGAYFCNWLNNGKQESWASCQNGAYDASTFGDLSNSRFTDQQVHSPGAKFWIPTLDEWMKAVHYDPNHDGPGQGGWWSCPYKTESPPVPGAPGVGDTTAGWRPGNFAELLVPLGAYTTKTTPYGLWDASGGAREWLEDVAGIQDGFPQYRRLDGAFAGESTVGFDHVQGTDSAPVVSSSFYGFRIAGAVPAPGSVVAFGVSALWWGRSRRSGGCNRSRR